MTPKLTDDAVSRLPLESGRAELLEEIMSIEAPERTAPLDATPARRRGWLAPLVAAVLVAGVAVTSYVYRDSSDPASPGDDRAATATPAKQSEEDARLLLDAPGWRLDSPGSDGDVYREGKAFLEVTRYPADSYDSYVEDREHISQPPAPGEPVEVLGASGLLWAYSADDHTVIREPVDGTWMEFRGQGMDRAAYLDLLGQLRMVSADEFDLALPDRFVAADERTEAVDTMLSGITSESGAGWPADGDATVTSEEQDPYQLGVAVAGAYACAWLEEFESATAAGDTARADEAVRVLGTSRRWPVLKDMKAVGFYSDVVWDYADEVAAGEVPEGYRDGLGCG